MHTTYFFSKTLNGRVHWQDVGIDGRIILKRILKRRREEAKNNPRRRELR
jgi:hypothetical protein